LLEKIAVECDALKGKVFNILGDVFEEKSLKDLIIEAIRYGDQPEVRARLTQRIDHAFDHDHLKALLNRNALAQESMTPDRLFKVKEDMERAEARRLQPFFVRSFFLKAFDTLGGTIHRREAERCEITHVPAVVRERDRRITGRNRREFEPILKRYERIAFTRDALQPLDKPGVVRAVLMHPGHPLMLALTDILLEQNANLLRRGAVLVDPADATDQPWLLFLLTHEVKSGDGSTLSKRMQFIRVNPDGSTAFAGWAPHLDLEPLAEADRPRLKDLLAAPWIRTDQEQKAVSRAAATLVPDHYKEVATRRIEHVELTLAAVHERLTKEIGFRTDREIKLKDDVSADNCGWDVTSYPPSLKRLQPNPKHIKVKGRVKGADTITVTRNEILYAFNQDDKFVLAIVFISPDDTIEGPYYVTKPFQREPDWGAASVNYNIQELIRRAANPH
jgi:hypothetical protein